ncbi:hypothetical protein D5R40_04830 [Okeania hirsuta]|uniref:Uncharacterized protein n=1 Tax=Okeania hirsuta TaxID=1458930 RepID=A0A3N6RPF0_9CYAN|nr:hypothetical protein D5R40_04830 [Okeania hirsuta]
MHRKYSIIFGNWYNTEERKGNMWGEIIQKIQHTNNNTEERKGNMWGEIIQKIQHTNRRFFLKIDAQKYLNTIII